MSKRRRERMSEGKKNIIAGLIQEYDIKTAADIQEALKDLLGGTIQEMMETELDEHLGYKGMMFVEAFSAMRAAVTAASVVEESRDVTLISW